MLKEEQGILMLFGADWEAAVTAGYDEDGFVVTKIELRGYYNQGVLVKFEVPAIVDLRSVPHGELEDMAEWFDEDELDDDFDIGGNRWVRLP
jgi:hypothetical protein